MAENSAAASAGSNSPKPITPAQRAFQRKVQRENYLTSGFENESIKTRMVDVFYTTVWPKLQDQGWSKRDEGHKVCFESSDGTVSLDRIKDVLSHIKTNESLTDIRNELEAALRSESLEEDEEPEIERPGRKQATPMNDKPRTRRRLPKRRKIGSDDTGRVSPTFKDAATWKYGSREFPKQSSQIGPQHQATRLSKAGTHTDSKNLGSSSYADLIWSPTQAAHKGLSMDKVDALLNELPTNIREPALFLLAEKDYDATVWEDHWPHIKPTDGSDWKSARIRRFQSEVWEQRKNIVTIAKTMRMPIKTVYNYYLAQFKFSDQYRLLKTLLQEEMVQRTDMSKYGTDECAVCGDGGNLLICDECDGEYHVECLRPALERVPEGRWECDECVDRKLLATRDWLIRNTGLFRLVNGQESESGDDQPAGASSGSVTKRPRSDHLVYEPTKEVLAACRKMALTIHETFNSQHPASAPPLTSDKDTESAPPSALDDDTELRI